MRIKQLDLLRYGHFTDAIIALPAAECDMHILLGGNEAGKSTTQAAVEDLLFGIPSNSARNFLHEYNAMRVGATVEKGSDALKIRRRKGNKDTLLADNDLPFPSGEAALAPFLAGTDRAFYARMFSLDHQRLRDGGKEILQAQDDVGQALFSASAGIMGLRETLKAMEKEAEALWSSRRAAHRKYFQADDRLKAAEASMREHVITTSQWQLLRSALETSSSAYDAVEQEIELKSAELRKLSRIRRVCRNVRKRAETLTSIAAIGPAVAFDADASIVLERAAKSEAEAAARIATLNEEIGSLEAEQAALAFDAALLSRGDDIQLLRERRIQVRAGKADLPKRRAELAIAEASLKQHAGELEWAGDITELAARIPTKSKIAVLRALLNRRGERSGAVENAKSALVEAEEKLADFAAQIAALGPVNDVSKLAAVIKATRARGDTGNQILNSRREEKEARAAIARGLSGLRPAIAGHGVLEAMPVPPLAAVEAHRDACRNLDQRHQACRERIRGAEHDLARQKKAYERIIADEQVIAPDELERLRNRRDIGWSIIRRRHVDGIEVSEAEVQAFATEELGRAFEGAIRDADNAADQRFVKHAAAAQLAFTAKQIDEQSDLLEALIGEEKGLVEEHSALAAAWTVMWANCAIAPADTDTMIEWLRERSAIVEQATRLATAERNTIALQEHEAAAKELILAELASLGIAATDYATQPLHIVLEWAASVERTHEGTAKSRRDLEVAEGKAANVITRKRQELESAETLWKAWGEEWQTALQILHFPATATPETAEAQINAIDDMREAANRIHDLRHERIEKIERDINAFEADVAELVRAVAPQLQSADAEEAVLALDSLAAEAARMRDLKAQKTAAIAGLQKKIALCRDSSREARDTILRLQETADASCIDDLRAAIHRSDELRSLQAELEKYTESLAKDGDGLSIAELSAECEAIDMDAIAAREDGLTREVNELRNSLMEANETRSNARRAFDAIGGDDRAARAAADRQAALAEMTEVAEQYVRLRSSILLLQWSIDRYRREKQAPILKRAGELFAILTCGSFQALQTEFDEDDNLQLAGIRQDGKRVPVSGMSTGTADQLYLALRVAAVEDYLEHAEPMPFIADDLFINFDDKRAAAGFVVLNELAKKTQVLFFTHHEHLRDVVRTTLGGAVGIVTLPPTSVAVTERSEAA